MSRNGYKRHKYSGRISKGRGHAHCRSKITSRKRLIKKQNSGEIKEEDYKSDWQIEWDKGHGYQPGSRPLVLPCEEGGYPTHGCVGKKVKRKKSRKYNRAKEKDNQRSGKHNPTGF